MLSGNGRHRRPRQAPALVVAAGVTGSAIAIPLLGATGASAASGTTWDQVAECETGGSWSADTGNGYYGGLNLSQKDWVAYGGLTYATSPDLASRSQQIAVAERLLADRGAEAWASCGILVGLDEDDREAGIDTGVAGDPASDAPDGILTAPGLSHSSGSSKSGAKSDSGSASKSGSTSDAKSKSDAKSTESARPSDSAESTESPESPESTESAESTESGDPTGSTGSADPSESPESSILPGFSVSPEPSESSEAEAPSSSPSASDSPSNAANGVAGSEGDGSAESAGSAGSSALIDTGTGRHRGSSAEEDALDGRAADSSGRHASRGGSAERAAVDGSYTVRAGDSLWGIADSLEVDGGWSTLYAGNKGTVGADPDLILPGQTLDLGVETGEK